MQGIQMGLIRDFPVLNKCDFYVEIDGCGVRNFKLNEESITPF
jgi:hypothetical protein